VNPGVSRRGRRIVGRIGRGEQLPQALIAVCRDHAVRAAEVSVQGALETVEIAAFDQARKLWKPARAFSGGFELLSLTGTVSERDGDLYVSARVAVMRERDNGVELLGGHLVSARVYAVEYVLSTFDDLILRRGPDAASGLLLWTDAIALPDSPEEPAPAAATDRPTGPVTWADVARVPPAKDEEHPDDEEHRDSLAEGDILIHPTFGRCEVERIEGSGEFVHVRLKNGRLVRLSLDVVKVSPSGREGDRRVFKVRVVG
jgi:predicted DNA-binding protein with PD1-like motif